MKIIFENITKVNHTHLSNVAGTDDNRPVIKGVFVDLIKKRLVVTDAHIMLFYPIKMVYPEKFDTDSNVVFTREQCKIVPLELFNKSKYMGNYKDYLLDLTYHLDDDFARVFNGNEEVFKCKYIDGFYPDYEKVVKSNSEKEEISEIGINMTLFQYVTKAIPSGNKDFKFTFFAQNKAINFEELNGTNEIVSGLIMPIMLR